MVDWVDNPIEPTLPAESETVKLVGRPSFERPANHDLEARKLS